MELITVTTIFALFITKLVDFVRTAFDPHQAAPKWLWGALAIVLGAVIAVVFGLNIFDQFSDNATQETFGRILTGVGMGAAGSGWHELLDALSSSAKKNNPTPTTTPPGKQPAATTDGQHVQPTAAAAPTPES